MEGKVVVVLGGGGLIGRSVAAYVGQIGASVVVVDHVRSRAKIVCDELTDAGLVCHVRSTDLTDFNSVKALISNLRHHFGEVHGVVNASYIREHESALVRGARSEDEISHSEFRSAVERHLGSAFLVNTTFGVEMRKNGFGGAIVHLSSIYGSHAPRWELYRNTDMDVPAWYAAAKGGLEAMTRYFAQMYLSNGIRVNAVAPGGIQDGQPVEFQSRYRSMCGLVGLLDPRDVAGLVTFLVSDMGRSITGQVITVDDGWSL